MQKPLLNRLDYKVSDYLVPQIDLLVDIYPDETTVTNTFTCEPHGSGDAGARIQLNYEDITLVSVAIDGKELSESEYELTKDHLLLPAQDKTCEVKIISKCVPEKNTQLQGLYKSSGIYCTQMEAEGFRRMTFFFDRPDVLSKYTCTVRADKASNPVLLSNGDCVATQDLENGRHEAKWVDPYPKPCYLFALVAGKLEKVEGHYKTKSGKDVVLQVFAEEQYKDRLDHALQSLKDSMKWDEERFDLEYDLGTYMIVAVNDFNFGAMENKGLNIFNVAFVLASPDSATDDNYNAIQAVVGHEYFHNWTGNRVTCRDWFQLTLKEGLTVFRDQEFTSDLHSRGVKRLEDVAGLRTSQFLEDSGPNSHPIRPDQVGSIDNFYTSTVYEKGSEIIRMYHTLLGEKNFQKGMKLYFERHDGGAVTCEDFANAMQDASGIDLTLFKRWYSQKGSPRLSFETSYDEGSKALTITFKQDALFENGDAVHMPIRMGLLDANGNEISLKTDDAHFRAESDTQGVFSSVERTQSITFENVPAGAHVSVLRNFSAPVILENEWSRDELAFQFAHDKDAFCQYEAGFQLATQSLLDQADGKTTEVDPRLTDSIAAVMKRSSEDPALTDRLISLPALNYLKQQRTPVPVEELMAAHVRTHKHVAATLENEFLEGYHALHKVSQDVSWQEGLGVRKLKNNYLKYLCSLGKPEHDALAFEQYQTAKNMTDSFSALVSLCYWNGNHRDEALQSFHSKWKHDPLVMNKWFSCQALMQADDILDLLAKLMELPEFNRKNPNHVSSIVGVFANRNLCYFHKADGSGYDFLKEQILICDKINPYVSARLGTCFSDWKHYDGGRQTLIQNALQEIASQKISKNLEEIISKSLAQKAA